MFGLCNINVLLQNDIRISSISGSSLFYTDRKTLNFHYLFELTLYKNLFSNNLGITYFVISSLALNLHSEIQRYYRCIVSLNNFNYQLKYFVTMYHSRLSKVLRNILYFSLFGFLIIQGCKNNQGSTGDKTTLQVANSEAVAQIAKEVFSDSDPVGKQKMDESLFEAGSAADQIRNYINNGFSGNPAFKLNSVNFSTGSGDLTEDISKEIAQLAVILNAYPKLKLRLESHTNNIGDEPLNKMLSELRVQNIQKLLEDSYGISSDRIQLVAFGQEKPIADNDTEEGRIANQRIEIFIAK